MENFDNLQATKKRNLSQVSKNSVSPSPPIKMATKVNTDIVDNLEPGLDSSKLKSIVDMDTDTETLHSKMDKMIDLMDQMMQRMDAHQTATTGEIQTLKEENHFLKLKLTEVDGKMTRMAMKISDLNEKYEDVQSRSMNRNILIHNIKEHQSEDIYAVVNDVLTTKLKIPDALMLSERYPVAPVHVDIAHRIGRPGGRDRPIVVQLTLRRGKEIIFNHVKNLKGTGISISEQLPSQVRERRETQFNYYKKLREDHKYDASVRVRLSRDKLFINNKRVTNRFENNTLQLAQDPEITLFKFEDLSHTEISEHSKNYFQGHAHMVNTLAEAKAAWSALLQNPEVSTAHHISYAYSMTTTTGDIAGQSDDGETGASDILSNIIQEKGLTNIFLAVSRHHNGPNLGKKRFEIIRATALDVLAK